MRSVVARGVNFDDHPTQAGAATLIIRNASSNPAVEGRRTRHIAVAMAVAAAGTLQCG
jgi:hypothetical protein